MRRTEITLMMAAAPPEKTFQGIAAFYDEQNR
jgi:hypothetical protein